MTFSASRAGLLSKCRYSFRPDIRAQIAALPEKPASIESRCGRTLHRAAEWEISGYGDKLLKAAVQFDTVAEVPRLALQWKHMQKWITDTAAERPLWAEVKFALDLPIRMARRLFAEGDRNYSECEPGEIPMTLDVLAYSHQHDDMPRFYDWKTGRHADGYSAQMALNALAVADWLAETRPDYWKKWQCVEGGVLHVTPDGIDSSRVHKFDRYDLAAIAHDLGRDLASIPGSEPTPGDHCREMYCKAFGVCPKTKDAVDAVEHLVGASDLVRHPGFKLSTTIQSADHAAWSKSTLRTFRGMAEEVDAAIEAFVGAGKHPLTDGGFLEKTYKNVSRTSVPDLIALALAHGATGEEIAACTYKHRESGGIRVVGRKKSEAA